MKKFVMGTLALGLLVFGAFGASHHTAVDELPEPTSIELTDI